MRQIQTEVLVIGGGATGTGVLRDLAMRGFKAILVEQGDLSHGTTGRYHGLLHSGGRYVVKDPKAAKECIEENKILRRIMPQCIEDTGGFFVLTPWDEVDYAPRFVKGCQTAGISIEEISVDEMLREEPYLNPRISRCFRVPDASADSFLGADLNAASAREHGAQILTYHRVSTLLFKDNGQKSNEQSEIPISHLGKQVVGALCFDLLNEEELTIFADMVVNASGAWAGIIAESAGLKVDIIGGKGTMLAMNHRIVNTVINRCKMPSDGDILVPAHTVSVIGTTDVRITDPDHFAIEPWEVRLCIEEGEKLIPGFKDMRVLRAWAGVRPLYQESGVNHTRDVTRAFVLLDHEERDGVAGLITITSGKWTTYRKMAEVTVDMVCEKLGTQRICSTHIEALPEVQKHNGFHYLGARLNKIEKNRSYGDLICECELVTIKEVEESIITGHAKTIDDIRRDVRLGMGPCQGGFCTYRVAGILHSLARAGHMIGDSLALVEETNVALRDFLQERWKGLLPILWGQQLRQERLDELIYLSVLNADHLPGPVFSQLAPKNYARAERTYEQSASQKVHQPQVINRINQRKSTPVLDVLVIGAGISGLVSAWQVSSHGKRVRVITKGWGTTYWGSGCIDVLGYYPIGDDNPIKIPKETIKQIVHNEPQHPYALVGTDNLKDALIAFQQLCANANYPMLGSLDRNYLLPTALGSIRPTCIAPITMIDGDLQNKDPICIVGFNHFTDFYPNLIADNLTKQGIPSHGVSLELSIHKRHFINGPLLAELFEKPGFRSEVIQALRPSLDNATRIGFPAVLGIINPQLVLQDLQTQLGLPVFEIPTLPPSIPGIRLQKILIAAIEENGGRVYNGMEAIEAEIEDKHVITVWTQAAARAKPHRAESFVLATGGILGGGIVTDVYDYAHEPIFNLTLSINRDRRDWFAPNFLDITGHPIFRTGIAVDDKLRPINENGQAKFMNLHLTGAQLGNSDVIRERSLEGVAIGTGYTIARQLTR